MKKTSKKSKPESLVKKIKIEKSVRRPIQSAESFVRELSRVIHNTNHSITCDNWFSSIPLFETMLVEYKISMTRTLCKNKPQIPTYFLQKRPEGTNYFAFDHNKVLLSYAAKKK